MDLWKRIVLFKRRTQDDSSFVSSDGKKVFEGDPLMKVLPGAYNCFYIASVGGGIKEMNLSSGKVRDLLLTDETGERIWCRELMSFLTMNYG